MAFAGAPRAPPPRVLLSTSTNTHPTTTPRSVAITTAALAYATPHATPHVAVRPQKPLVATAHGTLKRVMWSFEEGDVVPLRVWSDFTG